MLKNNKQGQVFTLDFIMGLGGFIVVLIVSMSLFIDIVPSASYETAYRDNLYLATTIIQEGFPTNWNASSVILPGITNDHRLNLTLLNRYDNINYSHTKTLYHITSDYLFFFANSTSILNISGVCTHGYNIAVNATCNPQLDTLDYDHFLTTERLVVHQGKIIRMYIYTWD